MPHADRLSFIRMIFRHFRHLHTASDFALFNTITIENDVTEADFFLRLITLRYISMPKAASAVAPRFHRGHGSADVPQQMRLRDA